MMPTRSDASRNRKRPRTAEVEVGHTTAAPPSKRCDGGGIYVPPYRATTDDADEESGYERRSWDALRRSITGLVNKATAANIRHVAPELLSENLVRVRGLLCRALRRSQAACPASFTPVFAALAAVANARLPCVGRLLLARLTLRARRAHAAGNTHRLAAAATFVAHLVNQGVARDLLALQLLALLLDRPTDGSVEVAIGLVTHCGAALQESCPRGLHAVLDCLRSVLHDGDVDKRVEFLIEDLFAIRKAQFRGHPPVQPELDLIEPDDQVTHQIELDDDELDPEFHLDVFESSPSFEQDEAAYEDLKRTILGDDKIQSSSPDDEETDSDDDESAGEESETDQPPVVVRDQTDTDLINLRRTIYMTEGEGVHELLRPALGQRLCAVDRAYQAGFEACFAGHYSAAHRMTTPAGRRCAALDLWACADDRSTRRTPSDGPAVGLPSSPHPAIR
ncbi:unnamed protein product [Miscanthus lutarioriparius]|uniref:MIF4G domain-containing protein n=1 Tax=Miscanthus lutarioriparius TaxID=422564 RepID=A0A811R2P2_9POAL|nr:unnamed protein product [Miscanthus lutarioriparius]